MQFHDTVLFWSTTRKLCIPSLLPLTQGLTVLQIQFILTKLIKIGLDSATGSLPAVIFEIQLSFPLVAPLLAGQVLKFLLS